jgi:inward rectifier potassium channel
MSGLGSTRVFGHGTTGEIRKVGLPHRPLADFYHRLVTGSWARLLATYAGVFFATQALFAALHLAVLADVPGAGGLLPALAAAVDAPPVAAPALTPRWFAAAGLSAVEGFVRWLELGVGAAILIAKATRVPARVLFSRVAVIAPGAHAGGRALLFRMANERTSHMVDAKVAAMLVWDELGEDGEPVRRAHDLALARGGSALFSHAWTAVHPIGRDSPLFAASEGMLAERQAELIVTLSGYDEGLTRVIHARQVYGADQILWDRQFREIVRTDRSGARTVDYRRFHETVPVEAPAPGRRAG